MTLCIPLSLDSLPSGAEHRLGYVDRDDAAMFTDSLCERQRYRAGAAADFEHTLAAGKPQTIQQQREAFLVAPFPEPGAGDPTRPGDRVPIAPLSLVRILDFSAHLASSPVSGLHAPLGSEGVPIMTEAKLAPNLPGWMQDHANRYLSSGGTEGHMYTVTPPGYSEMTVPSLLLTTTGRKSGDSYVFPLFYGRSGDSYFVIASKGGAPEHPGWYRNILANPEVEVQAGTVKTRARARTATGEERARLWEKSLEFWPPYADYQRKTEREIPVVVLDPVK